MAMKSNFISIGFALLSTPFFAMAGPVPGPTVAQQTEISDWMKSEVQRMVSDRRSAAATGAPEAEGALEIYSLRDFPAPQAVKDAMTAGMRGRGDGARTVAAGKIPSTSSVIANLSLVRRSNSEMTRNLSYTPADLSKTPLGAAELLSTEPTGSIHGDRSTGVSRFYRVPNVGLVEFSENDYLASRTRIKLIRETLNVDVNGTPARSYSVRSEDGKGKAELRWVTPSRSYWLTLISDDGTHIEAGEKMLMQIARGITP